MMAIKFYCCFNIKNRMHYTVYLLKYEGIVRKVCIYVCSLAWSYFIIHPKLLNQKG